jgi:hypothetical protein
MRRIIQQHPTLAARSLPRLVLAMLVALLLTTSVADAALTTGACLAQKRVAWGTLRKCQATEEAKGLKGKPADLAQCQAKFQAALTKISAKATKAAIACRYQRNGDTSVTDFDTGLMWERKTDDDVKCALAVPNCWTNGYVWNDAMGKFLSELNGATDSATSQAGYAGRTDWRLPTVVELQTILLAPYPCDTSPCIDPIFGPTVADYAYWSATTVAVYPGGAWGVGFNNGFANYGSHNKDDSNYVRAVRAGL